METVGVVEARTHLTSLLNKVAKGEKITITRHGLPMAQLVPMHQDDRPDSKKVIQELLEFRKGNTLGGLSIREMIDEGRR